MSKIKITICLGTTCHLLGSSHFQNILQELPESLRDHIEIKWERCLGYCSSDIGNAPYVLINEQLMHSATLPQIVEKIEALLS